MTLLTGLLAINWLEQKHQGALTRKALSPVTLHSFPVRVVDEAAAEAAKQKALSDPESSASLANRTGLLKLMRMGLFGMTEEEHADWAKAYEHDARMNHYGRHF